MPPLPPDEPTEPVCRSRRGVAVGTPRLRLVPPWSDTSGNGRSPNAEDGPRGSEERGSATVVALGAVFVLITVSVLALHLGSAVLARNRAEAAADLAALAAAAHATHGEAAACATARRVTNGMAVRLAACELHGWDAIVRTEAIPATAIADLGAARAAAKAGPAAPDDIADALRRRTVDPPR